MTLMIRTHAIRATGTRRPRATVVVMCNAPVAARAQNSHYGTGSSTLTPS